MRDIRTYSYEIKEMSVCLSVWEEEERRERKGRQTHTIGEQRDGKNTGIAQGGPSREAKLGGRFDPIIEYGSCSSFLYRIL